MANSSKKAVIERIKAVRTQYAGARGKSEFAKALGISPSTYNYYENNRVPPIETIVKICELSGADLKWLLNGEKIEGNFAFASNSAAITPKASEFLQNLAALLIKNPDFTGPIAAFVELLIEKKGVEKNPIPRTSPAELSPQKNDVGDSPDDKAGWIPILGRTAAGIIHFWDQVTLPRPSQTVTTLEKLVEKHIGKTIVASAEGMISLDLQQKTLTEAVKNLQVSLIQVAGDGEEIVEFVNCSEIRDAFPDSFALQIDGDSMSPQINDGDIVILSSSVPPAQGQIAVAQFKNQIGVTCKLIRTTDDSIHLIPINERYETKIVPKDDLVWSLAVLCHIRV